MKSKNHPLPPSLSQGNLYAWGKSPWGDVSYWEWTGKLTGRRTVCYRLRLPHLSLPDFSCTEAVLEQLRDAFLRYLQKESEQEGELRFGGLDFFFSEKALILSYAFCPFGRRVYFPAIRFTLSPQGAPLRLQRLSRPISDGSTPPHPATGNPSAKEKKADRRGEAPSP